MDLEITHGFMNDGSIFIDKFGKFRIADYNLIIYLILLKGTINNGQIDDLKVLGSFINVKKKILHHFARDFIKKCRSEKPSCCELLAHAFFSNVHVGVATTTYNGPLLNQFVFIQVHERGRCGEMVKVKQPVIQELYALKIIKIPVESKGKYTQVRREVDIFSKMAHKNVVKYSNSGEQTVDANELRIHFSDDGPSSGSSSSTSASHGCV